MRIVEQDGYLVVQEIIPGGTADSDGEIQAGDRARVLNSPDFKIVEVQIQRDVKRTNQKSVFLNQSEAESPMKELKAKEDLARRITSNHDGSEVFPQNYYNIELVHIATDYVQLLKAM